MYKKDGTYDVIDGGNFITTITSDIMDNITSLELKEIKCLYIIKHDLIGKLKDANESDITELRKLGLEVEFIEYSIQAALGNTLDKSKHRFWTLPKCSCPVNDNENILGILKYIISPYCLLHNKMTKLFSPYFMDVSPCFGDILISDYVKLVSRSNKKSNVIEHYCVLKPFRMYYNLNIKILCKGDIFEYDKDKYHKNMRK